MGYPDLKSDEAIVLTAQHVKVKSVPFELVLTNRRLILIDSEKNVVPTQQIPLITIRNVMISENAIRDPVITLTILTDTSDTRELALTFAMQTAGERRREAGEWVKTLKKYIAEATSYPVEMPDAESARPRPEPVPVPGTKKKIEISRPIKKITVDTSHLPPKPVETTSLPEGSFCSRCGNRIPPGSTFCNRCGTKVVVPDDSVPTPATAAPGQISTVPVAAPPAAGETKGRPIEQIIHSIEPLIDDSVPRTAPSPAVPEPEHPATVVTEVLPQETPTPLPAESAPAAAGETPVVAPAADVPTVSATPAAPAAGAEPAAASPGAPVVPPIIPLPPVPEAPRRKRSKFLIPAIIIVIVIIVAAGGFMVMTNLSKPSATQVTPVPTTVPVTTMTTVPTTLPTTIVTTVETTAVPTTAQELVPSTGVWVKVSYDKEYSGSIGTPGSMSAASGTGEHFYIVPTKEGTVAISLEKTDGSGDELKVTIYKDGVAVKSASTTTPNGRLDVQFSLASLTPTETATLAVVTAATTTNSTA